MRLASGLIPGDIEEALVLVIPCPLCGSRNHDEFLYYGDASKTRPAHDSRNVDEWFDYVYNRQNPKGSHTEYWQHLNGCREWLVVERDTATQKVLSVRLARELATWQNR